MGEWDERELLNDERQLSSSMKRRMKRKRTGRAKEKQRRIRGLEKRLKEQDDEKGGYIKKN